MIGFVERVAKALASVIFIGTDYEDVPLQEIFPPRARYVHLHERALKAARIAIEAARDPTESMRLAGKDSDCLSLYEGISGVKYTAIEVNIQLIWQAMIDEALK